MSKKRVAITGAKGVVGAALAAGLAEVYEIIPIDLPEVDATDEEQLAAVLKTANVVIHLAGVFGPASEGKENWLSPYADPQNKKLFDVVLQAALDQSSVTQFIHASSIHVEDVLGALQNNMPLAARPGLYQTEVTSGYGEAKRGQEGALQSVARRFKDGAVSLRLGGVRADNAPPRDINPDIHKLEQKVWLEHSDLANLVRSIIDDPHPGYEVMYAVSDNEGRFHDVSNSFGWQPTSNSANF